MGTRISFIVRLSAPAFACCFAGSALAQFTQTTLSSNQSGVGSNQNTGLMNGWGIASGPTGNIFVSSAGGSNGLQFNGLGGSLATNNISIPGATTGSLGTPTGVAFAGNSGFTVNGAPANFLFGTSNGTIAGWSSGSTAATLFNGSNSNSSFTGIGIGSSGGSSRLFAADFANGSVSTFDTSFNPISGATFTDPTLPSGLSPFNVRSFGDRVYVTYAMRDPVTGQQVTGAGNGAVSVFDTSGTFLQRIATGGSLDTPWGLAMAPAGFGQFSNALLVGNYGSGTIGAYNPNTGQFLGNLTDNQNNPIVVSGLWGIDFGNGGQDQGTGTLFYTAGPDNGANGAFGQIQFVPAPAAAGVLALGAAFGLRRRR